MGRISAQEGREAVIRAAIAEFARTGYHGTSTAAIANRVGVTQPYVFRLFPDKRAIFVAALVRSMDDTAWLSRGPPAGSRGTSGPSRP
ncbi:TetR/AcrR family transcriptional regulator [Streptomyces sp. NPDC005799]|uniref:TetR/AcrR family transcriptional regulator n=1 Tax=Streptomyces sp. NPDC005799 TaxID=3154678 RepID=UPI0033ED0D96